MKISNAVAVGFLLSVAPIAPVIAQDLPVVRVQAVAGSIGAVPLMIVKNEKLDEKYGINIEADFLGMSGGFQSFLVGNYDISNDEDSVGVAVARAEGFDVHGFFPNGTLYMGIVVPGTSTATAPADLNGKRVGHFGMDSGTTTYLRILIDQLYGFDLTQTYDLQQVGPAALPSMLQAGDIEAMLNFEPHVSTAMVATGGRYLVQAGSAYIENNEGFSPAMGVWASTSEWLKENPELAYAFRDAITEALGMISDSEYEILREPYIVDALGIDGEGVLEQLIENGTEYTYFSADWTDAIVARGQDFLQGLVDRDLILDQAPEQTLVTLESLVGPRP